MKERVTFYLKKPEATTETLIYAFLHFRNQRVIKAHPSAWNAMKYRLKRSALHAGPMNQRLDKIAEVLGSIYLTLLNEGHPITPEEIKTRYVALMRPLLLKANVQKAKESDIQNLRAYLDRHPERWSKLTNIATAAREKTLSCLGTSAGLPELTRASMKDLMKKLGYDDSSAVERLLIDHITLLPSPE